MSVAAIGERAATGLLAAPSGEAAKSGPWGLAIILLLCVACYFLFKSMSKQLRKVREEFPEDTPPAGTTDPSDPSDPADHDGQDGTPPVETPSR
jgi:hypothetical protein